MKALMIAVKEMVDNSLDACQEAGILPEVIIKVKEIGEDRVRVSVEDNGPGIVKEQLPRVFGKLLYGSKFYKMKQSLASDEPIFVLNNGKVEIVEIGKMIDKFIPDREDTFNATDLNLMVPAFDWKNNKYSFQKVSHLMKHKRMNEIYEITTATNRKIKVTGCHSLFGMSGEKIVAIEARDIKVGSEIVLPATLPSIEQIHEINILNYFTPEMINKNWFFVYGIEKSVLNEIKSSSEIIHKTTDKSRKYYRIRIENGNLDILDDSMKQYESKLFLPINIVLKLHLENRLKNGIIVSYYHGKKTQIPVSWALDNDLMKFLGLYIAEGHGDKRQCGFTFGHHEDKLIDDITQIARRLGTSVTIERRDRSYRVKVFGGIISILMPLWCGRGAKNKKIPEFVFRSDFETRQHFIDALYMGDGHNTKGRNQLMLGTVSKVLANQLLYLWLMQGVNASFTQKLSKGLGKTPSMNYVISVYGENIKKSFFFDTNKKCTGKRAVKNISIDNGNGLMLKTDLCLAKVRAINVIDRGYDYVYDISVPECENFVGGLGGISCHNSRGQQGIGVSAALLYAQLTTGKPAIIISRTAKTKPAHEMHIRIDTTKNEPDVIKDEKYKDSFADHGTYVEMEIEGKYRKGERSVDEYVKQTAVSNPFAKITFQVNGEKITYPRIINELPKPPKQIKPHPQGVEMGVFERMCKMTRARNIQGFLVNDFSRVGSGTARQILKLAKVNPNTKAQRLNHEELERVWRNLQKTKLMNPPTDCLSPIGEAVLEQAVKKDLGAEFTAAITRKPSVYRGMPFQIEVCIGYGGKLDPNGSAQVIRFANRVPLLYQASSCAITKSVQDIAWRTYHIDHQNNIPIGPMSIIVHMISVWIPYTSESKEAIDPYDEITKEIKLAIQDCGRKLKSYLSGRNRRLMEAKRMGLFEKYLPEIATNLALLASENESEVRKDLEKLLKKGVMNESENGETEGEIKSNGEESS